MNLTRRAILQSAGTVAVMPVGVSARPRAEKSIPGQAIPSFPDRANFPADGIHMDAAYTHLVGRDALAAGQRFLESGMRDYAQRLPMANPRDEAVAAFARLINVDPASVAIVPSTMEGEQWLGEALGLGPGRGVVTDALHYSDSLIAWGEKARAGMPLTVVAPTADWRIDLAALDAAITPQTRLVVVSSVSSTTGFRHDLAKVCAIAHAKGALVYADIIQEVGANPMDLAAAGVDFACAGGYKWLMGVGGAAFLYVRPDRQALLHRGRVGWRGVAAFHSHILPGDAAGPAGGDWTLGTTTAQLVEVSTPSWLSLAVTLEGMRYVLRAGPERLEAWRRPLLERLYDALPRAGWRPLTPRDAMGPTLVLARAGAQARFAAALEAARIRVSIYPDRIRISPSVHTGPDDIEKLVAILSAQA